jgi:bacteriorhodopsin
VKHVPTRLTFAAALAASLLCVVAVPAGALTPTVGSDTYKWFYWIGPVLALSFVGWLVMMAVGYYLRVLRPKYRGQKQP